MTPLLEAPFFRILLCLFKERWPEGPLHLMPGTAREHSKYLQSDEQPGHPTGARPGAHRRAESTQGGIKGCDWGQPG